MCFNCEQENEKEAGGSGRQRKGERDKRENDENGFEDERVSSASRGKRRGTIDNMSVGTISLYA